MAELFANVEVNRAPRWRRLARLAGLSLVLHALIIVALGFLPTVRDVLSVARLISGAEYVDEDYTRTEIGESVELITVSRADKLEYPPGYFAPKRPAPAVVPEVRPQPSPKPKPTPKPTPTPSPTPQSTDADKRSEVAAATEAQTKEDAEKAMDEAAKKNNVVRPAENMINKRPLKDWLAYANDLKTKGELDLSGTVEVEIVAQRDTKGQLHNPQVVKKSGDPQLVAVAKRLIGALNDSNALYFLEGTEGQVRFLVRMDQSQVAASVESVVESAERAQEMARGFGAMLLGGRIARSGKDEAIIYQNTRISARGKQIVVNFSMPRQAAGDMLKKQLPAT